MSQAIEDNNWRVKLEGHNIQVWYKHFTSVVSNKTLDQAKVVDYHRNQEDNKIMACTAKMENQRVSPS